MSSAGVDTLRPLLEQQLALLPQCMLRSRLPLDSILIFLAMPGAPPVPMRVQGSESVASVKLRIQRLKFTGFVTTKQRLVFGGHELSHGRSLVRDYGLDDGDVLQLVVRLADIRAISIETTDGKRFRFQVQSACKVGYLKNKLAERTGEQLTTLEDCRLVLDDEEELQDDQLVTSIDSKGDAVIHLFVREPAKVATRNLDKDTTLVTVTSPKQQKENLRIDASRTRALVEPITVSRKVKVSPAVLDMIGMTIAGLENGFLPDMSTEGSGGVYFMKDSSGENNVAVFKPIDEEPMAENNPRGLPLSVDGEGLKRGTRVGEGALREVAAYILDHTIDGCKSDGAIGFSGVPPTALVRCFHMEEFKIGSLQMFVSNCGSCEDMGPQDFPVEEVHKIAVLDIRLANADRHAGNILVCQDDGGHLKLVPIDHGYCLPEKVSNHLYVFLLFLLKLHRFRLINESSIVFLFMCSLKIAHLSGSTGPKPGSPSVLML